MACLLLWVNSNVILWDGLALVMVVVTIENAMHMRFHVFSRGEQLVAGMITLMYVSTGQPCMIMFWRLADTDMPIGPMSTTLGTSLRCHWPPFFALKQVRIRCSWGRADYCQRFNLASIDAITTTQIAMKSMPMLFTTLRTNYVDCVTI